MTNIALTGNPNCGKTTMFNYLTGSSQYVGNRPGVTVEKKDGILKGCKDVIITDLPGIYSLSPYTPEEVLTRDYIINEKPDVIINLVDASNIERNLYLTTQLLEMNIPIIIVLNMMDIAAKRGDKIDTEMLAVYFGCEVYEASALKGTGLKEAVSAAVAMAEQIKQKHGLNSDNDKKQLKSFPPYKFKFSPRVEDSLKMIKTISYGLVPQEQLRWISVKLFERDEKAYEQISISTDNKKISTIEKIISECENDLDDDSESIITNERYIYIEKILKNCIVKKIKEVTISDKIDMIVTHRVLALPIFAVIMSLVYFISVSGIGTKLTYWTNEILFGKIIKKNVELFLGSIGAADWITGLVCDGIIGGVGSVLGFAPQMMILFFFLSFLEDCGYMARVAFIMDKIFHKFGLSGKSFIPLLISSGCGVPGIMASRTIENEKERKMTITVTTFIPCSAKLPVIALTGSAFFPHQIWLAPSMYFLGMLMVVVSGVILKKTKVFAGDTSPFVMELPQYHMPAIKNILAHVGEKGKAFITKAGTVIFLACGIIWFLSNFGFNGTSNGFGMTSQENGILAAIGKAIAPFFSPLGFDDWQPVVATLTGIIAKENVVGTFGVLYGVAENNSAALAEMLRTAFTSVSALSFMVFNLLCAPCVAAIGAISREMMSIKWTLAAIGYQTSLAYITSFLIYQFGSVIFLGNTFNIGTIIAMTVVLLICRLIFHRPTKFVADIRKKQKKFSYQ